MKRLIFAVVAMIGAAAQAIGAGPAVDFTTVGSMTTFNSAQHDTANVGGIKIDGFVYTGGTTYRKDEGFLWLRNNPDDHGLGYCSSGETCGPVNSTGNGDWNELSNQNKHEVIRLTLPTGAGMHWTDIWVSSLDSGGTSNNETGTVFWSNIAKPNLNTLTTKTTFSYNQIAPADERSIFALLGINPFAKYLFFEAGPSGTNNDYLLYGANFVSPVPEPESYVMLLAGLALMGFVARRRKRNDAVL